MAFSVSHLWLLSGSNSNLSNVQDYSGNRFVPNFFLPTVGDAQLLLSQPGNASQNLGKRCFSQADLFSTCYPAKRFFAPNALALVKPEASLKFLSEQFAKFEEGLKDSSMEGLESFFAAMQDKDKLFSFAPFSLFQALERKFSEASGADEDKCITLLGYFLQQQPQLKEQLSEQSQDRIAKALEEYFSANTHQLYELSEKKLADFYNLFKKNPKLWAKIPDRFSVLIGCAICFPSKARDCCIMLLANFAEARHQAPHERSIEQLFELLASEDKQERRTSVHVLRFCCKTFDENCALIGPYCVQKLQAFIEDKKMEVACRVEAVEILGTAISKDANFVQYLSQELVSSVLKLMDNPRVCCKEISILAAFFYEAASKNPELIPDGLENYVRHFLKLGASKNFREVQDGKSALSVLQAYKTKPLIEFLDVFIANKRSQLDLKVQALTFLKRIFLEKAELTKYLKKQETVNALQELTKLEA